MPTAAVPALPPVAQSSSAAGGPSAAITEPPQLPAPSVAPLAKSEIAFTAILTPMKDTDAPVNTAGGSRQIVALPVNATHAPDVFPLAPISPVAAASNSPEPPATQALQPQAAVQSTGQDSNGSQSGGDQQQGGDARSQQQDDSTGAPAQVVASSVTKAKQAGVKQDDIGVAGTVEERALVADSSLTEFPDQCRVAAISRSDTPVAAQTLFPSTAEAFRASEPDLPAASQIRTGAAQEISIRIAQPDASTIDLRVVERSGQLHVDVRYVRCRPADLAAPGFGNAHQFAGTGGLSQRDFHSALIAGRALRPARR